ncbi:putative membrane-anchored protein [Mesorhizobium sangaii]|uniref:Putative membrane-anchored protein n=1 Tax=Mesorhizobium sangaii TaxID=505389 RepID=A0A841PAT6_9HYPH|nr:putative membrane-anchored protein [Mesorhizobium sangaii]
MVAYTVIWYTKTGILGQTPFNDYKTAKGHATSMLPARRRNDGVVSVEVRKDDGTVVFSQGW